MEVGGIIYLSLQCHHQMTSALRWAAMRAILMFHNCEGQSHRTMSTDHNFRRERRAEADSNRGPSAYQPNALPLGQTGSQSNTMVLCHLLYYAYQRAHMFSDCPFWGRWWGTDTGRQWKQGVQLDPLASGFKFQWASPGGERLPREGTDFNYRPD